MKNFIFTLILFLLVVCGCTNNEDIVCVTYISPAVKVTFKEVETGNVIEEGKGIGIMRDDSYIDTMESRCHPICMTGGIGRSGKYSISIELDGYERWTKENVIALSDECGVITTNVTAFLKKK